MHKKTLTSLIAGAMTLMAARAASSQEIRSSSIFTPTSPTNLSASGPYKKYELDLGGQYTPRGGSLIDTLADLYEQSELGKRRADKLRLKREGIPDFEPASLAMAPRKAGKAGRHFNMSLEGHDFRLYAEAYIIRNPWTRERRPGFALSIKVNY